jgi:hypothetical protein
MRPRVDPAREAGNNDMPGAGNSARELRSEGEPGRRGVAGADDRDFRAPQARKIAAHGDQGRGRGSTPQKRRIIRLANADKTRAQPLRRLDLAFGLLDGRDADRPARLAARDQGRQGRKCRAGTPMAVKQNTKCPGSNIFAAQEPQPVETLAVVEVGERFRGKAGFPSSTHPDS